MTRCPVCEAEVVQHGHGGRRVYCSAKCKRAWTAGRPGPVFLDDLDRYVWYVTRTAARMGVRERDLAYTVAYRAALDASGNVITEPLVG
jgi:hypothetical protein